MKIGFTKEMERIYYIIKDKGSYTLTALDNFKTRKIITKMLKCNIIKIKEYDKYKSCVILINNCI